MPTVKEKVEKRRSNYESSTGITTHIREFLVKLENASQGTPAVMSALPQPGSSWLGYPLTRIDVQAVNNSSVHFDCLVEFATAQVATDINVNPLARAPEVTWGYNDTTENYFTDNSDPPKLVVNSAGDKFANDAPRERGDMTITVVQNEPRHDPVAADKYSHSVNTDIITIDGTTFPPGTLKLSPITAVKQVEAFNDGTKTLNITFFKRTYLFKFRNPAKWGDNPWRDHFLDRGMYEAFNDTDPNTGQAAKSRRPIYDANNLPVTEPIWPLDGSGHAASNKDAVPAVLEFQPYVELPFAKLLIRGFRRSRGS